MSNVRVDTHNPNEDVELSELTNTAIGDLVYQAETLISELQEVRDEAT